MLLNLFVISIIYTPCSAALPNPTGDLFIAEYKKEKNGHPTISQNVLKTRGQVPLSVMKKSSPEIKLKQHTTKAARIDI